jgi:hypothetical protein
MTIRKVQSHEESECFMCDLICLGTGAAKPNDPHAYVVFKTMTAAGEMNFAFDFEDIKSIYKILQVMKQEHPECFASPEDN